MNSSIIFLWTIFDQVNSLVNWIHVIRWNHLYNKLNEFIVYVNPYVKWNHGKNEFMYDFLDEFTYDSKIIHEFIYYLSMPAWNHRTSEFRW